MTCRRARGLTLVEVVISTMLIAGLMVAAMDAVGASVLAREKIVNSIRGQLLADELLDHIVTLAYLDPDTASLGVDSIFRDEMWATNWGAFDDVDDFVMWSATPPQDADGAGLAGYTGRWRRSVDVSFVDRESFAPLSIFSGGNGVKRITVVVTYNNVEVGRAVALRTMGTDYARFGYPDEDDGGGSVLDALGDLFGF